MKVSALQANGPLAALPPAEPPAVVGLSPHVVRKRNARHGVRVGLGPAHRPDSQVSEDARGFKGPFAAARPAPFADRGPLDVEAGANDEHVLKARFAGQGGIEARVDSAQPNVAGKERLDVPGGGLLPFPVVEQFAAEGQAVKLAAVLSGQAEVGAAPRLVALDVRKPQQIRHL